MNETIKLCYWLQGFSEIHQTCPTKVQWKNISERIMEHEIISSEDDEGFMKADVFVSWLKGFVELSQVNKVTAKQWLVIVDHLQLVFTKVTPVRDELGDGWEEIVEKLKKNTEDSKPWRSPPPFTLDEKKVFCTNQTLELDLTQDIKPFICNVACAVYEEDPVV